MTSERSTNTSGGPLPMAVILAGGYGRRLSPLTDFLPKPLLPVGGKPMIGRILDDLEKEGVKKALILTGYKGEMIKEALSRRRGELELLWQDEQSPVGSAGCVKRAKDLLEDDFFVVCGDIYGARCYRAFYDFYRTRAARAAMLVTRVGDPGEYGIVRADADGRVRAFAEKPQWARVFSDTANAGVYLICKELLDRIPDGTSYDFGGQFFPRLLEDGTDIFAFDDGGVWRDVGDFASYLAVCLRENGGESVIGQNAAIAPDARVAGSLLMDGVTVGARAEIEGGILDCGCAIGEDCRVPAGCVLGRNARLEKGVCLAPGTVLPPGTAVEKSPDAPPLPDCRRLFSAPTLTLPEGCGEDFFPDLGQAAARASDRRPVGVFYAQGEENRRRAKAVLSGVCHVCAGADCGEAFAGQVGWLTKYGNLSASLFVDGASVVLSDASGLPPSSAFLRRMRDEMKDLRAARGDRPPAERAERAERAKRASFVPLRRENDLRAAYGALLSRACPADLSGVSVGVGFDDPPRAALSRFFLSRGARVCERGRGKFNVELSDGGRRARLSDESGTLDFWHLSALLLARSLRPGARICLPYRAPQALFDLARAGGAYPQGYALCPENDGGAEAKLREDAFDLPFLFDGCFAVAAGISLALRERRTVAELLAALPPFAVVEARYDCAEEEKLPLLLGGRFLPAGEGLDLHAGGGRIVKRAAARRGIDVMIEAAREEDCLALFSRTQKELEEQRKERPKNV